MLRIKRKLYESCLIAPTPQAVQQALQMAVQLELATIPPYLTGLFSVQGNTNRSAAALVQSVVTEEMLHMTLAANTLIATGAYPNIPALAAELVYPGALPGQIDDDLTVTLQSLSIAQVTNVFMAIERPDTTDILPGETTASPPPDDPGEFGSIGDFYNAIIQAITTLGDSLFVNQNTAQQVDISQWFPPQPTAPAKGWVLDVSTATAALQTIIAQGEGAPTGGTKWLPTDGDGSYAHYFKFGEIANGAALIPDPHAPSGWSYTGPPVPLDPSTIYNFLPNATLADYPPGSAALVAGERFYNTYQMLLGSLNTVFNGQPQALNAAMGLMYQLKLQAEQVAQYPVPNQPGVVAAPPFMRSRS